MRAGLCLDSPEIDVRRDVGLCRLVSEMGDRLGVGSDARHACQPYLDIHLKISHGARAGAPPVSKGLQMSDKVKKVELLISGDTIFVRLDDDCVAEIEKAKCEVQFGDGVTQVVISTTATD